MLVMNIAFCVCLVTAIFPWLRQWKRQRNKKERKEGEINLTNDHKTTSAEELFFPCTADGPYLDEGPQTGSSTQS